VTPAVAAIDRRGTHRLIPAKYSDGSVLEPLADTPEELQAIFDLDGATNERLRGEQAGLAGILPEELVWGVHHERIIRAAYLHPHPQGARFNGPDRGCWYAGYAQTTSIAEVSFHKTVELLEIDVLEQTIQYDDYLADFNTTFHDLRDDSRFEDCLDPGSYTASQRLAAGLLKEDSNGVVYPSVRHPRGTVVGCFRPPLVQNVRKGETLTFIWEGETTPRVERGG